MSAVMDKVLKGRPGVVVKTPDAEVNIPKSSQGSFVATLHEEAKAQAQEMKKFWTPLGPKDVSPCTCSQCRGLSMDPMLLADRKQRALDWVNALRTEWGHAALAELPRGRTNQAMDCVISRALPGQCVVRGTVSFPGTGHRIMLPPEIAQFVTLFDQGAYPELVA